MIRPVTVWAAVTVIGLALGLASRAVDTAATAPPWIGWLLSPWLATAFFAGAAIQRQGPLAGLITLGAVVGSYLAVAGADAGRLWVVLLPFSLVAGPVYGWAGATSRSGGRGAALGLAVMGVTLSSEGLLMQLVDLVRIERMGFALETVAGALLLVGAMRSYREADRASPPSAVSRRISSISRR